MSIVFAIGVRLGELTLLRRIRPSKKLSSSMRKRWKVRCSCGNEFIIPEHYMKRPEGPKRHCGCKNKTIRTIFNQEYRIWLMMHQRCYSEKHVAFKHYGGRGIGICEEWNRTTYENDIEAFKNFLEHIGPRPSMKYSIDRIEVDGNYEPGNIRWATDKEQAANKRKKQ